MKTTIILGSLLVSSGLANAALTNLVFNGGFESPAHTRNDGTNPEGWTVVETTIGSNTDRQVRTKNENVHSGSMALNMNGGGSRPDGELYQTVNTEIGQIYRLSIWGRTASNAYAPGNINFQLSLLDGEGLGGSTLGSLTSTADMNTTYQEYSLKFSAASTKTTIWIQDMSTLTANLASNDMHLDDVSITAVPEPSSTTLLSLGGLSLILRRRK
ncbi:PEP-CTERM sorting domain-containing protein [Verrucomicrobiaceae bacterium N1E253]|uniref:PEP-CTERM sorting domain-containing protein n=1 Tax=Oceaniferula marina TaxID=2748318 RepID=A0A851GIS6_9BACT|nr:carbohydrate binding domain-containing protein [Oceaniferula marina]NWK55027.1 PEP-CTERM sorting domain-containing protein [Oceaniferula marina]